MAKMELNVLTELCEKFKRTNDDCTFMQIVNGLQDLKYYFIAKFKINKFKKIERREIDHLFSIGILEGIRKYNPNKGTYFSVIFIWTRWELEKFLNRFFLKSKMKYPRNEILFSDFIAKTNSPRFQQPDFLVDKETPEKKYLEKEFLEVVGNLAEKFTGEKEAILTYFTGNPTTAKRVKKQKKNLTLKQVISLFIQKAGQTLKDLLTD